ncbi:hypothetical protein SSTU70S_03745 [Stutzerimonas stutzeri]
MNLISRTFATSLLALALQPAFAAQAAQPADPADTAVAAQTASTITTVDGVQLYYKDWGPKDGPVVTFSHGWPLARIAGSRRCCFLPRRAIAWSPMTAAVTGVPASRGKATTWTAPTTWPR